MKVSVVVPVYNEEANLDEFFRRALAVLDALPGPYELLVPYGHKDLAGTVEVAGTSCHLSGLNSQPQQLLPVQLSPAGCARSVPLFGSIAVAHGRPSPVRLAG